MMARCVSVGSDADAYNVEKYSGTGDRRRLCVCGVGVDEGAGAWLDVGGADVGIAFKLFTTTEINAVLPG